MNKCTCLLKEPIRVPENSNCQSSQELCWGTKMIFQNVNVMSSNVSSFLLTITIVGEPYLKVHICSISVVCCRNGGEVLYNFYWDLLLCKIVIYYWKVAWTLNLICVIIICKWLVIYIFYNFYLMNNVLPLLKTKIKVDLYLDKN